MISREQFEALVRAEADVKYAECNYRDMGVRIRAGHKSYIAARMEHEWPLVAALSEALKMHLRDNPEEIHDPSLFAIETQSLLDRYTTKPIER